MGEVCDLMNLRPYVIEFWEEQFDQVESLKSENGQKLYEREHVETIAWIKKLLFSDKLTINQAKKALESIGAPLQALCPQQDTQEKLQEILTYLHRVQKRCHD